ncbi:MAG: hypothetical protein JWM37_331 [Candidatus Saccharibacteria bacterium]|nr:hypothetical protein [Candidatus Saccharibacteria bacterium]
MGTTTIEFHPDIRTPEFTYVVDRGGAQQAVGSLSTHESVQVDLTTIEEGES